MTTVTINNEAYRITSSTIPDDPKFDRVRAAYARRGIAGRFNALPPHCSVRHVQVYVMADGTAQMAHSVTDGEVAREASRADF